MSTILFIEDDPLEAHMIMPLLKQEFGDVRRAVDGAEALWSIENADFASRIALVVTGQLMSGIRKAEFVAELHERMPEVPVLVLGSADDSPGDFPGRNVAFLPRPFAPSHIVLLASKLLTSPKKTVA
jgi:DNA-binding NtrC family response regulator